MPRKRRPLDRTRRAPRDTNIIVIACEDTHAVKQYFAKFRTKRTQYKVLPTLDGNSSPRAVLERLNVFKAEYATEEGDELWICIDADHWIRGGHQAEFSQVLQECPSKGYGIAVSNPYFEVWLLMHYVEIDDSVSISDAPAIHATSLQTPSLVKRGSRGTMTLSSGERNQRPLSFSSRRRLASHRESWSDAYSTRVS